MGKHVVTERVEIKAPNLLTAEFRIRGTAPYVQNKFSAKAREQMRLKQEAGSQAKKGAKRDAKNFQECYENAQHKTGKGENGIPAPSFRNAMISACRIVGFQMTRGKLAIFIEADAFDKDDGTPLVLFKKGKPHYTELPVRNESGVADIRARPMWDEGWEMSVRVRFDGDMFTKTDISNLLMRAGQQVGIGEGRPDSKNSCGMGWGLFTVL